MQIILPHATWHHSLTAKAVCVRASVCQSVCVSVCLCVCVSAAKALELNQFYFRMSAFNSSSWHIGSAWKIAHFPIIGDLT